ncbi:MAG: M23 family metallopeptidase [Verrucomicrobia bacterium]|nr:M23 family metallopeptidase [Verrucomicrobiota bacterium]
MGFEPNETASTNTRTGRVLYVARPARWIDRSLRSRRRYAWIIGSLGALIAAELIYLLAAGTAAGDRPTELRIGPLEHPAEEVYGFDLLETGDTLLSAPMQRAEEMLLGVVRRAPDLIDEQQRIPWGQPCSLERGWVSSPYGMRVHPTQGSRKMHKGIDLAVDTGTPVHATARGVIVVANPGYNGGYGQVIYIDHGNGIVTRYAHLSRIDVEVGHHVERGERVGLSGATGNVTGAHLHYEIRVNGDPTDPAAYLPKNLPTTRPEGV